MLQHIDGHATEELCRLEDVRSAQEAQDAAQAFRAWIASGLLARPSDTFKNPEGEWERLHDALFHIWPGRRPWYFPVVERPDTPCPYAYNDAAAKIYAAAQDRWREIEASLAERDGHPRRATARR
jgi:hypothetical protein